MRSTAPFASHLHQHRRYLLSRVDQHSRHIHSIHIRNRQRRRSVHRPERCKPQPHHHRIRPCHLDRLIQIVDTRREQHVLPLRQLPVYRRRTVPPRLRDIVTAQRITLSRRRTSTPRDPRALPPQLRNPHRPVPHRIHHEKQLLPHHRRLRHLRIRRLRPLALRHVRNADKHHIPVRA